MINSNIDISILIPAFNESKNFDELINAIENNFIHSKYNNKYEIIIINDGSTDDTINTCKNIIKTNKNLTIINLKENYGKAHALDMGIQNAKGDIIATIDADLQYSPANLIEMIEMIHNGDDIVNGSRKNRKDNYFTIFSSSIYNFILRFVFRIKLNDFFSGIKVYKKEIYKLMDYSGMVRFIVFYSKKYNFNINQLKVEHFNRKNGKTSYNFYDKIILSMQDIFSLIFCVYLGKKGFYNLKQFVFIIYFILFLLIFFYNFFVENLNNKYFILTFISLVCFIIFNFIVSAFLDSKSNKAENLIKNILK